MQRLMENISFFQNLMIPDNFGTENGYESYFEVDNWCEETKEKSPMCFAYLHGVSKVAFVFPSSQWVVKIPFNGFFSHDDTWYPFEYAAGDWDYCKSELKKYEKIVETREELIPFFAETRIFCHSKNGHPMYLQEKVTPVNEDSTPRTPSKKSLTLADKFDDGCIDRIWLASAIDFYGEDKVEAFMDYIYNVDDEIGVDLHTGNIGYRRSDGSPCVLDFSGWFD